ncbi:Wzz/FepE/Etk N-terminal domain-containing protein [Vibrio sp. Isolate25]|uniref:Wzz/FepE/Etk N-terminal domain-containing protein n=1 Tax=Vibrio TaxID=662 RepID=UPI001EFD41F6|nr:MULTISPECIES: Wzz/FepE/Etk N-terminal domain-containing protein [Vibrio]MCG9597869.1 Wzz/FepE/Etk N-terminal domain-containing protein [Vibrio sp. Isolate25]USD32751.1 LPS O-antigen length regulator [Vibrio sp. SCSIO 43186]USD45792.1 LPS O-antigen length regulator [Vibrio sp. SCSIO 43145]USD69876.1 LPS O-antigen length regulator [Vibrio sp. SCSIO 43139]USD94784.1 LPS O-antigen length regulator [Vibrio coralliilyticus]
MNKPIIHDNHFTHVQDFSVAKDEIDLRELCLAIWKGKWIIFCTTALFAIGGVLFALSQPNTYQASATLVAANDEKSGGLAAMASQFGGLASLAGINVNSGKTDDKSLSLATLESRKFINAFIDKYALLPILMATQSWDKENNKLVLDPELYDGTRWLNDPDNSELSLEPTAWQAYKAFKELLNVSEAKDTGIVTVSITHLSPFVAQQWTQWLVKELNLWMKEESLTETNRNIEYLEQQLERTKVVDMQNVFYQLIEEQTKTLMLAEVKDEYAFKVIDPPVVPEEKNGPKRALICVLATLLGGMLGVAIVLVRYAFRREND